MLTKEQNTRQAKTSVKVNETEVPQCRLRRDSFAPKPTAEIAANQVTAEISNVDPSDRLFLNRF